MIKSLSVVMLAAVLLVSTGCGTKRPPVLVAQSGFAVAQMIGQLSGATTALQQANLLPAADALRVQEQLLRLNAKLAPLPEILRAVDRIQQAGGQPSLSDLERALEILQSAGVELTVLLNGIPISETTKALVTLVQSAQTTVQTVLVSVAQLKGGR